MATTTFYKLHHANDFAKECYVGSTKNHIKRLRSHKSSCNNPLSKEYNYKVNKYIRNNDGFDNWEFTILEHVANEDYTKIGLLRLENQFIAEHGATLNNNKLDRVLNRQRGDIDNHCDICNVVYRGKYNKTRHQNTAKCKRVKEIEEAEDPESEPE